MTRLEEVIQDVKESRKRKNHAWIFDDEGVIRGDVICGEVLDYLDELKDYEIEMTDEKIEKFRVNEENKSYNTYNNNANISNDLEYTVGEVAGDIIGVFSVHLQGDIRGNYTDFFACQFDYDGQWLELESVTQYKDINERYVADINIFCEGYEVYDIDQQDTIGEFYEIEKGDLLREIRETENEKKRSRHDE